MRFLPRMLLGLAVAVAPAQDRSAYNEALVRFNAYLWENRLSLADWCKADGLVREARSHYQFIVLNGGTGNPFTGKAQAKLRGDWKNKPSDADPEKWTKYREKLHEYFRELGSRAWRIHAAADK